jgi:hypothetical protein
MRRKSSRGIDPNIAIREQAAAVSGVHRRLYPWADRLRRLVSEHTGVDVPDIVIGTARLRRNVMGFYVIGRNALRLRGNVMLNTLGRAEHCRDRWQGQSVRHQARGYRLP